MATKPALFIRRRSTSTWRECLLKIDESPSCKQHEHRQPVLVSANSLFTVRCALVRISQAEIAHFPPHVASGVRPDELTPVRNGTCWAKWAMCCAAKVAFQFHSSLAEAPQTNVAPLNRRDTVQALESFTALHRLVSSVSIQQTFKGHVAACASRVSLAVPQDACECASDIDGLRKGFLH